MPMIPFWRNSANPGAGPSPGGFNNYNFGRGNGAPQGGGQAPGVMPVNPGGAPAPGSAVPSPGMYGGPNPGGGSGMAPPVSRMYGGPNQPMALRKGGKVVAKKAVAKAAPAKKAKPAVKAAKRK